MKARATRWAAAAAAALLGALGCRAQCVVEGTVRLPKAPHAPVMIQRYGIVSSAGVLSPFPPVAVVYLEGPFPRPQEAPRATVAQKDMNFVPALLPVQVGTRVEFPNLDPVYHNIFSYSPAKRFDLGRYRSDERPIPSVLFDAPGMVTLRCDIHEHMRAIVLVLDTPFFTVSDPQGVFRLAGLPPGRRVLRAWLDSRTTLAQQVDLETGRPARVSFP
jgi:plastocyanin